MLDISAFNAFIIFCQVNPQWNSNKLHKRRIFLETLGEELAKPYINQRKNLPRGSASSEIVRNIQTSLQVLKPSTSSTSNMNNKRGRCKLCTRDIKTTFNCYKCKRYICKRHCNSICEDCSKSYFYIFFLNNLILYLLILLMISRFINY